MRRPMEAMEYRKLSDDITDTVIEALQYFEHIDKYGPPMTFAEASQSISGGSDRYRSDPVFRAKVQMLVSRLTVVVRNSVEPTHTDRATTDDVRA